jgi:murein L,D-transpeptidase YcbB/YkuD
MGITRRSFSLGGLSLAAFGAMGVLKAFAEDPIDQVLQSKAAEWSDGFDAAANNASDVRTTIPTLSPEIIAASEGAIQKYSDIVARGGWPMVPADRKLKLGMKGQAVALLRERLTVSGDLAPVASRSDVFDSYVEAAVRRLQARHGIPIDGQVGNSTFAAMNIPAQVRLNQLATNLTRLKMMMAKPLPNRFVMVNIPAAAVEAVEAGRVVSRHTAIVGKVDRPSPIVNSKIYEVNFNPFWTVPESIIRRDLIPKVQKNPNYLAEQHIRIYTQKGEPLSQTQINWNTNEAAKYLFRQDPGDFNSLGSVKINFYSKDGVYMHDTPSKGLFNDEYRFDSSGCVRVQNIRELITWLLRDTKGWDRAAIDNAFRSGERIDAKLSQMVPVFWVYITAWAVSDGVVNFRNDIYGLDGLDQLASQAEPQQLGLPQPIQAVQQ